MLSKPFDCRFYKQTGYTPVNWLGQTKQSKYESMG